MRNKPNGPSGLPESAPARQPGGASGVPPMADGTLPVAARTFKQLEPRVGPKVKRYRVLNGGSFMMGSVRTTLRAGKEIADNQYDIPLVKRVGIRLEEIVDEAPALTPASPE